MLMACYHFLGRGSGVGFIDFVGGKVHEPMYDAYCNNCHRWVRPVSTGVIVCQFATFPIVLLLSLYVYLVLPWENMAETVVRWKPDWEAVTELVGFFVIIFLGGLLTYMLFHGVGRALRTESRWVRVICGWLIIGVASSLLQTVCEVFPPDAENPHIHLVLKSSASYQRQLQEVKHR